MRTPNLRGAMIGINQVPGNTNYTDKGYQAAADIGAQVVRHQLTVWDLRVRQNLSAWQSWLTEMLNDVEHTLEDVNIPVVIDLHTPYMGDPGLVKFVDGKQESYDGIFLDEFVKDIWLDNLITIAKRFQDNPKVIAIDILNEPNAPVRLHNKYMAEAVKVLREAGWTKVIIVTSILGDPLKFKHLKPIKGKKIWYTFHWYQTGRITYQGVDPKDTHQGEVYPNKVVNKKFLKKQLRYVEEFMVEHKVPARKIFVGEMSCSVFSGYPRKENRIPWAKDSIALFNKAGYHWIWHAVAEYQAWDPEVKWTGPKPNPTWIKERGELWNFLSNQMKGE